MANLSIADCIVASGKTVTYCERYPALGGGVLTGKFNPAGGVLSFTATPDANNAVRTARYGAGFAFVVGNSTPDAAHANEGWLNEHNIPLPLSAAVIAALGLPLNYQVHETDVSDMSACNDWVDQVLRPTIAATEAGAPPAGANAAIASAPFQKATAQINAALGTLAAAIGAK